MFFITRNEILANVVFFAVIMIFKVSGIALKYNMIFILLPILLATFLSKLRSNRVNIPVKGKNKKNLKQGENFLNDRFVDNKSLSYGATILWLSTLFVIVTELVKGF